MARDRLSQVVTQSVTPTRPDIDVIVVGAGPAGSECARGLAAAGFQVLVVEEHPRPGEPVHCTGVISAHAYSAFDLPVSAIQCEVNAAEVTSPGGITLRVELNGNRAYTVDRRQVDLELASRAQQAGADYCYGARVRSAAVDKFGVTLTGVRADEPWTARARSLVLATGAKSRLPRQVGLAASSDQMHGAQSQVPVASPPVMQVWLGQQLVPGGFGWVVPGETGWSRVGVLTRGKPRQVLRQVARSAMNGASEYLLDCEMRVHPIPSAPRHPTFGDRVLAVGDAAGQVKMTTGGGVYYGLLAARLASEVLADGLHQGRLGARRLARYEKLWHGLLGPEQRAGLLLRKLASSVSDEKMDEIFRTAERRGLTRYLLDLLDFDWHARPGIGLALAMLSPSTEGSGLGWLKRVLG
jgi:geranylgeranyl reductase family protein